MRNKHGVVSGIKARINGAGLWHNLVQLKLPVKNAWLWPGVYVNGIRLRK
jgi:hypothetical protein